MPVITAHACQTSYQRIGSSTKTILLLHGWRNNWQAWSFLIADLSKEYSVLIPDLPGFGQSESPKKGWSTNEYILWLQDFLVKLEITELEAVIGHSYGGKLAAYGWLASTCKLPLVTKGLFLVGPSGIPNSLPLLHRLLKVGLACIPKSVKRGIFGSWRTALYSWLDTDADYLHSTQFQEETLQKILGEDLRTRQKKPSNIPLHLFWGERDTASPLWMAYQWLPSSTQSEVFVFPQGTHFAHQENKDIFKQWLRTWLQAEETRL
jgi:pimeloyl-ACP methyl ester carboxylesterase